MDDCTLQAVDSMTEVFYTLLCGSSGFKDFEDGAMDACVDVCAAAMACALERLDRSFWIPGGPSARASTISARARFCASAGR